jgi:putative pyruvate formate lyase activating enzyme
MAFDPGYLALYESGELGNRIKQLLLFLESCALCPRACRVNRLQGEVGVCGARSALIASSVFPHFGEEPPLVGHGGSGTIFFTHCNLKCVFCQNYEISHLAQGEEISSEELATQILTLQQRGCHNINFVTPTHFTPQLIAALPKAIESGLRLPLVYNCGGYESVEVIKLLEGIIDIYMPDAKFADPEAARNYCKAKDYPEVNKQVLKEMHRQTGVLKINPQGIAERGLLIRHLVMPEGLAGSKKILRFIAEELSKESYVNIMAQYYPQFEAVCYPELNRRITPREYHEVIVLARSFGLHRGFPEI